MLSYNLDITDQSVWLRTTPGQTALAQPYYATEAGLFYAREKFETSRSHKDSYLIFYTISGKGYLSQNGFLLQLIPGTAVIIDCRSPQQYGTSPDCSHWTHYWIHTDGAGVSSIAAAVNTSGKPSVLPVSDSIREIFEHLLRRITQENTAAILSSSLDIHRILQTIASAALHDTARSDTTHPEMMEMAAEYMREHYTEDIHLETLLSLTHISRAYFLRLFQQYMGTTPYNFLIRTRITRAKALLEMTDLPVSLVAQRTGFPNETNFSARFHAVVGITPGKYRKQFHQTFQ